MSDFDMQAEEVIFSEAQFPAARLISHSKGEFPLDEDWRKSFAILKDDSQIYLFACEQLKNSARVFQLIHQLKSRYPLPLVLRSCTAGVLLSAYARSGSGVPDEHERTDIEKELSALLNAAVKRGASDIHIESRTQAAPILFRINGLRQRHSEISHERALSLGQLMYGVYCESGTKATTWNPNVRNDGAFTWPMADGSEYTFRFSSSPLHPSGGFQIVLRVLSMGAYGRNIASLGYAQKHLDAIENMTASSSGFMVFCGATNSGKSTSIQATLREVYLRRGEAIKVLTVEEPVEYVIPGACQIPVARRKKEDGTWDSSAFTDAIMGALRQDPDIMMVGEIRDSESARVVKDFVLAGRPLVSTLHTYSFIGVFRRLLEIEVPWEVITMDGFWAGIVYQRLLPVLCSHCARPWADAKTNYSSLFVSRVESCVSPAAIASIKTLGHGCPDCEGSGVVNRTVCAEVWRPTPEFMRLLADNKERLAYDLWLADGGVPIINHAIEKMLKGEVCPTHIESNIGLLPPLCDASRRPA